MHGQVAFWLFFSVFSWSTLSGVIAYWPLRKKLCRNIVSSSVEVSTAFTAIFLSLTHLHTLWVIAFFAEAVIALALFMREITACNELSNELNKGA